MWRYLFKTRKSMFYWWKCSKRFYYLLSLFYLGDEGQKCPMVFLKYLQNYLLNWLEIFKVWFSDCLKVALNKFLKIGLGKALNHALSWMTSYQKKNSPSDQKILFKTQKLCWNQQKTIKNCKILIQCCKYVGFTHLSPLYC